jgi:hypothetical protein
MMQKYRNLGHPACEVEPVTKIDNSGFAGRDVERRSAPSKEPGFYVNGPQMHRNLF